MNPHLTLALAAAHHRDLRRTAECCRIITGRAYRWRLPHRFILLERSLEVRPVVGGCCA